MMEPVGTLLMSLSCGFALSRASSNCLTAVSELCSWRLNNRLTRSEMLVSPLKISKPICSPASLNKSSDVEWHHRGWHCSTVNGDASRSYVADHGTKHPLIRVAAGL